MSDSSDFRRLQGELPAIQDALREQGLDGWLLYDLHARNRITTTLLGLGDLSRRYFVLVPAQGEPHAVVHRIEEAPWSAWPWRRTPYSGWRELEGALSDMLSGVGRAAMEVAARDAIPALDLVPVGVVQLIESAGVEVVSSAELVTRFHSRWTADGLASHRRAGAVLAQAASEAFAFAAAGVAAGESITEGALRTRVLDRLRAGGLTVGADAIVAWGPNAADPHYHPSDRGALLRPGAVLLLDLWGKESEDAVFADQTWMAYIGEEIPDRVNDVWLAVRDARVAAVQFIRERCTGGEFPMGYEVDAVSRALIDSRGFGAYFIHRTGHSIDVELHGTGPNIDDFETHETRRLVPGTGFSIEPGVYLPGDLGIRSEIDVYMTELGPEVTTPDPQMALPPLLR
ncbi:MAG TPA: M24 family metallopeptidase [Longimicrobiales bacterium]|nr:M24 family metallopeptidase [Longimicrobiales bacterium]